MAVRSVNAQPGDGADVPSVGWRRIRFPGRNRDAIEIMQAGGPEYPQIWHMFAFRPAATEHLARFTQEIMRVTAPLSPGIRELIAAFTSYRNNCPF
jgi:hypothetical protein